MSEDPNRSNDDTRRVVDQKGGGAERQQASKRGDPQSTAQATAQPQSTAQATAQPQGQNEGSESVIDAIQRPTPVNYIKGIVGSMAVTGALLGVGVFLVARFGGLSLYPGIIQQFTGMPGVGETMSFAHQITIAYQASQLSIFLAFLMAPLFGLLVAVKMDDTPKAKMGAAGVGVGVGALVFTVIVVLIASFAVPDASDLLAIQEAAGTAGGATAPVGSLQESMIQGVDLGSSDIVNSALNGLMVGIPAGIAAAAIVFFDENFFN